MSPETKKHIRSFMIEIKKEADIAKSWDLDQFTVMRLSLIYSIADQIAKHLEV